MRLIYPLAVEMRPRLRKAHNEDVPKCICGCCHFPDHGACPSFEAGTNARCVYCDHSVPCHYRDRNKPTFNTPLGYRSRDLRMTTVGP